MRGLTRDGKSIGRVSNLPQQSSTRCIKSLRSRYYNRRVRGVRKYNPQKWWQEVKRFTGQSTRPSRSMPWQRIYLMVTWAVCLAILISLCRVCRMIRTLGANIRFLMLVMHAHADECIIDRFDVESKLSRIDSHKSSGPDELLNWFLNVIQAEPVVHWQVGSSPHLKQARCNKDNMAARKVNQPLTKL